MKTAHFKKNSVNTVLKVNLFEHIFFATNELQKRIIKTSGQVTFKIIFAETSFVLAVYFDTAKIGISREVCEVKHYAADTTRLTQSLIFFPVIKSRALQFH